jgi:hypothetical protein
MFTESAWDYVLVAEGAPKWNHSRKGQPWFDHGLQRGSVPIWNRFFIGTITPRR